MKRVAAAGLALAVSATASMAADLGKGESGKRQERAAREMRFHRVEARGHHCPEGYRPRHAFRLFLGEHHDWRCRPRQPPIWRGYPQSR